MSMSVNPSLSSRRTAKAASPQVYFCGVLATEMYNLVGLRQIRQQILIEISAAFFYADFLKQNILKYYVQQPVACNERNNVVYCNKPLQEGFSWRQRIFYMNFVQSIK